MVKYLPRAWAARWASFQRADITEIIIETCSRIWWRDAAAATLTLQGSRQALLSGACLSAPRDCNCICRVILHRSDPSVLWKVLSKHTKPRRAPVKEGSRHLGFSRASKLKQKQNTRPWRYFKREIWFVFVFQRLDGSLNNYPNDSRILRYVQETYCTLHKRRLCAFLCIMETINASLLDKSNIVWWN